MEAAENASTLMGSTNTDASPEGGKAKPPESGAMGLAAAALAAGV
jgi:MYXO-CTERM domain-containing protein